MIALVAVLVAAWCVGRVPGVALRCGAWVPFLASCCVRSCRRSEVLARFSGVFGGSLVSLCRGLELPSVWARRWRGRWARWRG